MVVEEPILLVPQRLLRVGEAVHRVGDVDKVLPEFAGKVFVNRILLCQHEGGRQHAPRERRHPARAVGLAQHVSRRQLAAIERADVVHSQEAALKYVLSQRVFAIYPPGEVEQHLVENAFQECVVGHAGVRTLDIKHGPRRHREHGRIHVAKIPFVRWELAVRVHVPLAQHQNDLILGELRIDVRERRAMKAQVPRGEPGELPFVGHRDHVAREEMPPFMVAGLATIGGRRRLGRVAFEPVRHHVVVVLLRPQHAGERLPGDHFRIERIDDRPTRHHRTRPPLLGAAA